MYRWIFILLIFLFQALPERSKEDDYSKYKQALAYYDSNDPSDYTDSMAFSLFKKVLNSKNLEAAYVLDSYEKCGNLSLIKGDFVDAIKFYREGLKVKEKAVLPDTLLFPTYLFLGETYYQLSRADSSIYFLEKAEKLLSFKSSNTESSRLYNSLGVIYYESGNYTQSINYFTKAKNLVIGNRSFAELAPFYQYGLFSFLNNIGSSLLQLNQLDSALSIYRTLEKSRLNRDQVNTQIASIFLDKFMPDSASVYLAKIESKEFRQSVAYLNQLAEVYLLKNDFRKAKNILWPLVKDAAHKSGKDFRLGRSYRLLGKIAYNEGDYEQSLQHFQHAIIQIDGYFELADVFKNPEDFSLGFGTFSLMESLTDKASAFIKLYELNGKKEFLDAGISTFQTAFDLAFYVSNYYDNDEARIFLGDFVLNRYQEAVDILLAQYKKSGDSKFLSKALQWSERSKSTSLNIAVREKNLKKNSGIDPNILAKERDLQFAISRLQQAVLSEKDNAKAAQLQESLTDKRLELSRLQKVLHGSPEYVKEKLKSALIDVSALQKDLLDKETLILSFFETKSKILLFALDNGHLNLHEIDKNDELKKDIQLLKNSLLDYQVGQKYQTGSNGHGLFSKLLGGLSSHIDNYSNLMIIPHGSLIDFPFEVLEKVPGEFLLNDHAITYQYSMQLLGNAMIKPFAKAKIIGFAPFFGHSWSDSEVQLDQLPFSKSEMDILKGEKFIGTGSTKKALMEVLPKADYLQLSTHAIPDPKNPDLAFIALYPGNIEDRLYTNEVVNMDLSHTSLVFLSACETNFGSTSRSEGVLSISRAFMLAGCQNIISSLWKAEDKATAYITKEFYSKLAEGQSFGESLRLAKLKMMADPQMAQYQHPIFWAHLVLVGDLPMRKSNFYLFICLLGVLVAIIVLGFFYFSKKRRSLS